MAQVIWIDDGAGYMLKPLVRMLGRRGFNVTVYTNYQAAMHGFEMFSARAKAGGEPFPNVIADLVIPRSESGTLDNLEVGLKLVRQCASLGAVRVIIFSVVARVRVSVDFSRLQEEFSATRFFFLEKMGAGPVELVDSLASFLGALAAPEEIAL